MRLNGNTADKAATQPLFQSLGHLVNGLARLMRTSLEARLRSVGLTPTTWTVLMALAEEDQLSQTDIAHHTFLDGATITRALDILEAKELIERNRNDVDRRVQIVALTDTGRKIASEVSKHGISVNNESTSIIKAEERRKLEELLRQLINHNKSLHMDGGNSGK